MPDLIHAVADWRQEAKQESDSYLYERADFKNLTDGNTFLVVGRKGAGKTATVRYIARHCRDETRLHCHLSARDLDFQDLTELSKNRIQAEGFWREIILTATVALLNQAKIRDEKLNVVAPIASTVSELLSALQSEDVHISYGDAHWVSSRDQKPLERALSLKRFLAQLASRLPKPLTVFVTFDEVDASFRHDATEDEMAPYLRLLEALISAAQITTGEGMLGGQLRIRPVVLMRSDLQQRITNNDRTKWRDDTIELAWQPSEIQLLLAHRLSVDSGLPSGNFAANWNALFEPIKIIRDRYDNLREKPPFYWLELRTQWRPRDYIVYLREAALKALAWQEFKAGRRQRSANADVEGEASGKISFESFVLAEESYSHYIRAQLEDEGLPHMPDLSTRLRQLGALKREHALKRKFSVAEFVSAFEAGEEQTLVALATLYRLNAIGNLLRPTDPTEKSTPAGMHNRYKFHFKGGRFDSALEPKEDIVIHPGLYSAL